MHTTLAAQLAQLELGHLRVERIGATASDELPGTDAVAHTLAAIWSDLFALFPETALEDDAEELAWGLVNLFHRAAVKRGAQIDRATDEIRALIASADGSEVQTTELEAQIAKARAAEVAMLGLEAFREEAAILYTSETGSSWRPAGGSRLNHSSSLTSAVVDGRDYCTAHVRRLEALRRAGLPVERQPDGSWLIAPDHLDQIETHEQRLRARMPVTVSMLSAKELDLLPGRNGATWLDREIVAAKPVALGRGFGAEVRAAIDRRLQWLAAQRLIDLEGEEYRFRSDLVARLEGRELKAEAARIEQESGRDFRQFQVGDHVEGVCRGPVKIGDRKFALVEHSREFSLVPWRRVLERQVGREISGVVRRSGISWSIGRERSGPEIGF